MKHFVVEITYRVPADELKDVVGAHRAYLQTGIDHGIVLCSGPQASRLGGIVLLRADAAERVEEFFALDPYQRDGLADYRIIEFSPLKFQPALADWVGAA